LEKKRNKICFVPYFFYIVFRITNLKIIIMAKSKKSSKKTTKKTTTTVVTTTTTTIDKNLDTHYLLVLDRSGSMQGCWNSTIEGLNEQLGTIRGLEEKYPEQRYFITLVAFDSEIETIIEDKSISEVDNFDGTEFPPRGMTSLHDAMGVSVSDLKIRLDKKNKESDSISTALVVIMTDGGENHSKEYRGQDGKDRLKKMIDGLEETGAWTFSFMGANQDAVLTAGGFGIAAGNSVTYASTARGASAAYTTLDSAISNRANANSRAYTASLLDSGTVGLTTFSKLSANRDAFMSEVVEGDEIGEDTSNLKEDKSSEDKA
jgi:hypothetical protein